MGALPPARVAGAMLEGTEAGGINSSGGMNSSERGVLIEQLEWAREWAGQVASGDVDPQCRLLATGQNF